MEADPWRVLGRGRSRLASLSLMVAPDARRSRTHPSCPYDEALIRAVDPFSWTHTRAILKCQRGETNGRARGGAGARRAAGAVGKMAPCRAGAAGATEDRGDDDAGAHAKHVRRRTLGLRQLTFPPRPISRLSSASLPSSAAFHNFLSFSALEGPKQPMCSPRCQRRARVGRRVP